MVGRFLATRTVKILAFFAPLMLIAGCVEGEKLATVEASRIIGTWSEPSGGRISFSEKRTFEAHGIDVKSAIYAGCPAGDSTGTWGFFVDEGKPGGFLFVSREASSGETLGITFDGAPEGECEISLNVIQGGETLCATDDPDFTCGLEIRFSRR
ncbi:hypothetical protein [Streptomyces sp. NPDC001741]|uniref:hypothetical protein n=1 Tax=Streptomyces sp. NPDC001741 TaxID=3364605 RepID=UPI00367497A3